MICHTLIYKFAESVSAEDRDQFLKELSETVRSTGLSVGFDYRIHEWLPVDEKAIGMTGSAIAQIVCEDSETMRKFSELTSTHEFIASWRSRISYEAAYANHPPLTGVPADNPLHHAEHTVTVHAPVAVVWDILLDVEGYARIFPPTQDVKLLEESPTHQIARLVVDVNGETNSWISRRDIDADNRVITYRQLEHAPIVGHMGGQWRALPLGDDTTQLVLTHEFRAREAVDGKVAGKLTPQEADAALRAVVERNSVADLGAVKTTAEATAPGNGGTR
ncbi:aromatase/cyclase [Streptomyces sp. NBC_00257]|uniref:aromatase/cyclase n=1 Tax=Streptomyces TaxID=1883 RepID=UPI0022516DB7|nr:MULTISPECIES: aromatase/cyclase [unclassified Streptomyces]WTB54040.1 aromatase/cyclase [Streptomyces sp. NBC_00826]WTH93070.1 aromatase/cyclase [Streptomyces sp. NBC_00825]WTI01802.1 aromatase/cyclase [Streptomyces sp. NBC_00822]MCX4867423.1 aromatase/cyclase [Streptomyces sp. NBC_00906]MCX4898661.1 aromatase/cyclase [Streptomyces sp. NBC_00892]